VGPGDSGAWWAVAGCGRARQRGAVLTHGPGSTVPSDSVFKPNQNYFKRIQNSPNFD
jgi:hypothetical protein